MRKIFLAAVAALVALATPAGLSAEPAPANASILFVTNTGALDANAQVQFEGPALAALGPATALPFEPSSAIFSSSGLSMSDRNTLLAYPDLLVSSSRAPALLNTRYLVLARVIGEKHHRLEADLIDIQSDERYHLPVVASSKTDQLMSRLAEQVKKRINRVVERNALAVVGNTESMMYHLANADHTDRSKLIPFADEKAARAAGYRPCPICFAEENQAVKADTDEGSLPDFMTAVMHHEGYPILKSLTDQKSMDEIAQQLVRSSHLGTNPLVFKFVNTDDIFGISYTGGEVYMSMGLLHILETPDEKAALVAHELAHLERDHFLEYYREQFDQYGPPSIQRFEDPTSYAQFLLRMLRRLMHDGFPLSMEEEADDYAVQYMLAAGYKPEVYAQTLHKIQEAAEAHHFRRSAWTRIHPLPPERLSRLADLPGRLSAVMQLATTVAAFDPGAASAMRSHAATLAPALPSAQQFATVLQSNEGTAPLDPSRGEPRLRN